MESLLNNGGVIGQRLAYSPSSAEGLISDGLVLNLDAGNTDSYPGSGTTWFDISDSSTTYDGTLNNGPTFDNDGGGSIVFDGGDDWVGTNLGSEVDYLFAGSGSNWTVQIWFKTTGSNGIVCGSAGGIGSGTTMAIYMNGGDLKCRIRGTSSNNLIQQSISTSQFSCATVTWDGSSVLGRHNDSSPVSLGVGGSGNQQFLFGIADPYEGSLGNYSRFPGKVAICGIYNRALSESEIQENYNTLASRFGL